jgi:hypothetical protein
MARRTIVASRQQPEIECWEPCPKNLDNFQQYLLPGSNSIERAILSICTLSFQFLRIPSYQELAVNQSPYFEFHALIRASVASPKEEIY